MPKRKFEQQIEDCDFSSNDVVFFMNDQEILLPPINKIIVQYLMNCDEVVENHIFCFVCYSFVCPINTFQCECERTLHFSCHLSRYVCGLKSLDTKDARQSSIHFQQLKSKIQESITSADNPCYRILCSTCSDGKLCEACNEWSCNDCLSMCSNCESQSCLKCDQYHCYACSDTLCGNCTSSCYDCGENFCESCVSGSCKKCGDRLCDGCTMEHSCESE